MQPMATTAALKTWSSLRSSPAKASASVGPSARSIRITRPPEATRSSERIESAIGPKAMPEPWVEVEMTPATVWAS